MSDIPATPKPLGRKTRILLAVSLALNLAIVGVMAGGMLRGRLHGGSMQMGQDLGFGVIAEALRPEDRRALRQALIAHAPDLRDAQQNKLKDAANLLATLRSVPFDPQSLNAALVTQQDRLAAQLSIGRDVLASYLGSLSDEERLAFAERLEKGLRKKGGHENDKPKD